MSKSQSATTSSRPETSLPEPISPREGALVHVQTVPFEWSQAEEAGDYHLQIARDAGFEDVVVTVSAGETTAATLYHTLDNYADEDLHWRVGTSPRGPWGPSASFHAAGDERIRSEQLARDRAAREAASASLAKHLETQERMPVVLSHDKQSGRQAAVVLGLIVMSFVVLLVVLFIFGWIEYPAEAVR